jgi:hypothetical protein
MEFEVSLITLLDDVFSLNTGYISCYNLYTDLHNCMLQERFK